jgi:mono/diheme cytochrome c family protein
MRLSGSDNLFWFGLAGWLLLSWCKVAPAAEPAIDFNRDIRPILSDNCYQCHGPDKNQRKAHLRLDTREGIFSSHDGVQVVVAGKPEASEIYRRLTATDKNERMPAPKSGKTLTAKQIALVKQWIEQGAVWKGHWAYLKPERPSVPAGDGFVSNPIDAFVLARLKGANLSPSPEVDRVTLMRRLSFDLRGLPPTMAEVDAFLHDDRPDAYESLVDRLLASPHYGERMALFWLDLVRYADSIGYHSDNPMHVWPYRDYVIGAFNSNRPFDQFTIEQLAGDLLPNATREQKVASGYNRLLMTTEEGGAQPKEYEAKYAADRVRNVSTVWLGATMGCCQCHDHKFDPYATKDFYRMAAFFADVQEAAVGRREAGLPLPTAKQAAEMKKLDEALSDLKQRFNSATPALAAAQAQWEKEQQPKAGPKPDKQPVAKALPDKLRDILAVAPEKRSKQQTDDLAAYYRTLAPSLKPLRDEIAKLEARRVELVKVIPTTLVSLSGPPRTVRVLPRGNWLDESGEIVSPAVPQFLSQPSMSPGRATRLDLARWIVARDNPLTARAFVNRLWKLFYGQGLSKTLDDLGAQGEWPTHPELMDWLAVEFMDSGWDVKHMVRLMVTSASYRQTAEPGPLLKERDPYNRLLGRQSRFRLDAEMVRDNALAVSGLLCRQIGGPSVKPYQPAGYWEALNFPPREWHNDTGTQLYRRGLYTHWQRTFLHPSLLAFDAPTREECTVDRPRSNIPQQALALLNDPTYVEAARVFAERIMQEGGAGVGQRLQWAYRCALSRSPRDQETKVLAQLYAKHAREYGEDLASARALLGTGAHPPPEGLDAVELAAWTSVARVILNLHETITRN